MAGEFCESCHISDRNTVMGQCPVCQKWYCIRDTGSGCFHKPDRHECQKTKNVADFKRHKAKLIFPVHMTSGHLVG